MSLQITSPLVETAWLAEQLGHADLRIIDCSVALVPGENGTMSFAPQRDAFERSNIPGSVFVSIPEQLSAKDHELPFMLPPEDHFGSTMRELGVDDSSCVVLYDRSNHAWAARVWWMLRAYGFDNAAVLNGGFRKWQTEQRPLGTGASSATMADKLTLKPRLHLFANKQDVLQALDGDDTLLVNALPRHIFTGEVAPYGRAGRIPGSKSLPCDSLVDADSCAYLQPDTVRTLAANAGVSGNQKVIAYCGGGIAASSAALMLTHLGHSDVAVYDGSMSEWCADPNLPLETGDPDQ